MDNDSWLAANGNSSNGFSLLVALRFLLLLLSKPLSFLMLMTFPW
jgi:hypothetical protein